MQEVRTDCLVLGGGIAGLTFAIKMADRGHAVTVLAKETLLDCATNYAQGGIAAVFSDEDSFEAHIADTLEAGAGLCNRAIVELCVQAGPPLVRELIALGVQFSKDEHSDRYDLTREGGHSARRVLHAGDITGQEILRALLAAARARPNLQLVEQRVAVDLLTRRRFGRGAAAAGPGGPGSPADSCLGAYVLASPGGEVATYRARVTVLATGGGGKAYLYTSNPDTASGDGVAMAYRAGLPIANMEFFQFHPTVLYHPYAKSFLISEALRGEGAILRRMDGYPFARDYDPRAELAPRDIVARGIDAEMKRTGDDHVCLDLTQLDPAFVVKRFPNIHAKCMSFGIDMRERPIPVVPAAHYMCGGVPTDRHGATGVNGLYAVGEVACTGLHGANRLASNSLLEGLVFADQAARHAHEFLAAGGAGEDAAVAAWDPGRATDSDEAVVVSHNWDEIRRFMWNYVGIVRSDKRLQRARRRIEGLQAEIHEYYWRSRVTKGLVELRNLALLANMIVESAIRRRESRGLHFTRSCPQRDDTLWARDTLVRRGEPGMFDG